MTTFQHRHNLVFISYSRQDRDVLERLQVHLKPIAGVKAWTDDQIPPAALWEQEINTALGEARAAVLLVSPDFLASDYVTHRELPAILAARHRGLPVLPVFVAQCADSPAYRQLAQIEGANDPGRPLRSLSVEEREVEISHVVNVIGRVVVREAIGDIERVQVRQTREVDDLIVPLLLPPTWQSHLVHLFQGTTSAYWGSDAVRRELTDMRARGLVEMQHGRKVGEVPNAGFDLVDYVRLTPFGELWAQKVSDMRAQPPR